jgi:mRNA interferase RelE/StbE
VSRYSVQLTRAARKELTALPTIIQDRIITAIEGLEEEPRPAGCKKLRGSKDTYRIRVRDYRIVYEINDDAIVVLVIRIRHRRDAY